MGKKVFTNIVWLFGKQEVGIWRVKKRFPWYGVPIWCLWPNIRSLSSIGCKLRNPWPIHFKLRTVFIPPLPEGGGGYTVLPLSVCPSFRSSKIFFVTFFSVTVDGRNLIFGHKLRQTGSRNLTGQKTLPTIWGTYMKLVTKYQISAINSCWEKCDEKWAYTFSSHFSQLLLMAEIWYLVTSFI
jgi:hypothetical protein